VLSVVKDNKLVKAPTGYLALNPNAKFVPHYAKSKARREVGRDGEIQLTLHVIMASPSLGQSAALSWGMGKDSWQEAAGSNS
jgi:hypothetical protein